MIIVHEWKILNNVDGNENNFDFWHSSTTSPSIIALLQYAHVSFYIRTGQKSWDAESSTKNTVSNPVDWAPPDVVQRKTWETAN